MKKFYTAVVLALASAAAFAQPTMTPYTPQGDADGVPFSRQSALTTQLHVSDAFAVKTPRRAHKADTTLPTVDQLIKTQPEGTLYKNLYRNANVYMAYGTAATNRTYDGYAGDIVVSNDGKKLYMKNPFLKFAPGTWIVGDLDENGTVDFKFPQIVYHEDGGITGYAYKMSITQDAIAPDSETQSVKYKWDGSSLTQVNSSDVIGLTNADGEWLGYGVLQNTFTTITEKLAKPADTSKAQDYRMTYYNVSGEENTASVKVLVDGNDMYIGEFMNTDFWVKGTINGNKVTFAWPQYLGLNNTTTHAYMLSIDMSSFQAVESLELTYDAESGMLYNADGCFEINIGKNNVSALEMYIYPRLEKMDYSVDAPATPTLYGVMPYGSDPQEPEIAAVVYVLSNKSASGADLNENNIVYRLYLDGELQTFSTSDYQYIKADMTDIPYAFTDSYTNMFNGSKGWDFQVNNGMQFIYIYKPFNSVGVQAIYVDGDNRYESQTVTAGISGVAADNDAAVKSVTWHDLSGRAVSAPSKGIYMKTVTYTDGTTKTVKLVK